MAGNGASGGREHQRGLARPDPDAAHAKKKSLVATEQDAEQRAIWQEAQPTLVPEDLVFLDETSTQTNLTRTHGRAPKGQRLVAAVPRNHGPNLTCLAAVTVTGIGPSIVFEGALDGPIFTQWVAEKLVPSLRPGQLVILDNLSVHKVVAARKAIEAAGCDLRFLPAYSPDFNPIEQLFSRLKTHLRAIAARTIPALMDAIGAALNAVTAAQSLATFRHAGYGQ